MIQPRALRYINLCVLGITLVVLFALTASWLHVEPIELASPPAQKPPKLVFSFFPKEPEKSTFGPPFLSVETRTLPLRLPDLRTTLMYFGSNHRPDISDVKSVVNMGIRGSQQSVPVSANAPIYLVYEPKTQGVRWSFSPNNAETAVWIQVAPGENSAEVTVFLATDSGEIIKTPPEFAKFTLTQMHMPTVIRSNTPWEINGLRVDSSLLIRQRAMWFGQDQFLQEFGGDQYSDIALKERIDFMSTENPYFCYVGEGSCLAWVDGRWRMVEPGPDSRGKPLLVARKINERSISFDLWDEEGKNKIPLELHKAMNPVPFTANIDIKLIGARSKKDWIVSVAGSRLVLKEDDWLVRVDGHWKKIATIEDLDNYVSGKTKGLLIALNGTEKDGNDVSLVGTLFDETRTRKTAIKVSLFKSWETSSKGANKAATTPGANAKSSSPDDEDDEDDDDDDDDEDDDDDDFDDDEDDDEVT